jgi:mRNA interferase MazF
MVARGTILIVSTGGGLRGKPRPAVVVQESRFDFAETIIVVPLTSYEIDEELAMPLLLPDEGNGLAEASRFMTHRMGAIPKSDVGRVIGLLSKADMERVDLALQMVLGLG